MPITREEFENTDTTIRGEGMTSIIKFLKENKDKAYTAQELVNVYKGKPNSIHVVLRHLTYTKKLILKRGAYYCYKIPSNKNKKETF
jgi:rRNA maturation protein Rpf1